MNRHARLKKLERLTGHRFPDGLVSFLYILPSFEEPDMTLGFHSTGPRPNSGTLVYDPAVGIPPIPYDRLAPGAHVITVDAAVVEPSLPGTLSG